MRLDEAATVILAAVQERAVHRKEDILYSFLAPRIDEIGEFLSLLYGKPLLKPEHIMSALHRSVGMFPEEFELVDNEALVPALASESPNESEESMTIPEALDVVQALADMKNPPDIRAVFKRMGRNDALVLWNRAMGEKPLIPRTRIIRTFGHRLENYSAERIRSACAVEELATVLRRAQRGNLPEKFSIEPGYCFKGPSYRQWQYWTKPFDDTYYEILTGNRYIAHITQGRPYVFDWSCSRVRGITPKIDMSVDCVVEIDQNGEVMTWLHTTDDPDLWQQPHKERSVSPQRVKDSDHMRLLAQNLEKGERLRLIDGSRPFFHSQHVGGFVMPRRVFELPLLITGARLQKNEEWVELRIEALDGFDPSPVGIANVKKESLPTLPAFTHIPRVWTDISPPLIGQFHALRVEHGKLHGAYLVRMDTSLGFSDALQLSEILEREHGPE